MMIVTGDIGVAGQAVKNLSITDEVVSLIAGIRKRSIERERR